MTTFYYHQNFERREIHEIRGQRGEYWLSEYTALRKKKKTHKQAVDIIVKPYKGQRKEIAKELEYTGALWTHEQKRTKDTSGATRYEVAKGIV